MSAVDMLELTISYSTLLTFSADPGHPPSAHDVQATVLLGQKWRMVSNRHRTEMLNNLLMLDEFISLIYCRISIYCFNP